MNVNCRSSQVRVQLVNGSLVSCFIKCLNEERYIRQSILSLFAQTYRPLEIVVVDDHSTDKTWDIILEIAEKNRLGYSFAPSGMCAILE